MRRQIMIEPEKCVGCLNCTAACMNAHCQEKASMTSLDFCNPGNAPRLRIYARKDRYYPLVCRNCDDPDCVRACMSGALKKNRENGLVEYDTELCAACFMCVMMCRYGHPQPDINARRVVRCTFCQDTEGREPACAAACPTKALCVKEVGSSCLHM